jgi:hypothetical protein
MLLQRASCGFLCFSAVQHSNMERILADPELKAAHDKAVKEAVDKAVKEAVDKAVKEAVDKEEQRQEELLCMWRAFLIIRERKLSAHIKCGIQHKRSFQCF